ncbi:toll-like receptor 2 [Mercenaria mercenaria]|uniref:toll-like receptor 2 n=1 Tax=Mercenaria mercenaria TaxID=6596 RepID=UPI00234EBE7C|nr:toll-like receptor 2 [Mercenaria mercenaria]
MIDRSENRSTMLKLLFLLLFTSMTTAVPTENEIVDYQCMFIGRAANCSHQNLTYIPKLKDDITYLIFEDNNLPNVTQQIFRNISNPEKMFDLKLGFNKIVRISADALDIFYRLKLLDLSGNHIIAEDLKHLLREISENHHLRTLLLNDIGVDTIKDDIFSLMKGSRVEMLHLQRNTLTHISESFLWCFEFLKNLVVSHNLITQVDLLYLVHLNILRLDNNEISKVPKFCKNGHNNSLVPNLQKLCLSYNNLFEIQRDNFKCLDNLKWLEVKGNVISVFPNDFLRHLPNILSFNAQINTGQYPLIEPYAFRSKSLAELKIGSHKSGKSVFSSTTETFKYVPRLITLEIGFINTIDMSKESLHALFSPLTKLKYFKFYNCEMPHDPRVILSNKTRLEKVILDRNYIQNLSSDTFKAKPWLKHISLTKNKIGHIKQDEISTEFLNTLDSIDLSRNPFICDCDLEWFITWLKSPKKTNVQFYPEEYECTYPNNVAGKKLSEVYFSYRQCHPFTLWEWAGMICGPCVFAILVLLIILYRNRWNIKHYIYLMRKRRNYMQIKGENCLYDAFIAYNQDNSSWVREHLIPVLEDQHNLKMCIHERDFQAGVFINDNIVYSIEESKQIILILSNSFSKSAWCMFEMKVAHSKHIEDGTKLVVILLEEIWSRNMNESMKVLLKTTTYIEWTEDCVGQELFWNKLKDAVK